MLNFGEIMKKLFFVIFIQSVFLLSAADFNYEDYNIYKTPDKDRDFNIETGELRKWSESYARIWTYSEEMVEIFPLGLKLLKEVDTDKDKEISKRELRAFQMNLDPIFEKAYEEFTLTYDKSGNGRIEKSELAEAFLKYPTFFDYFNKNVHLFVETELAEVEKREAPPRDDMRRRPAGEDFRRKPPRRDKKALDDIYD